MATATAQDWRARAREAAVRHGLDPDRFERQIDTESRFNPAAQSPKGAYGLGQLMPDTARELGVDPKDPDQNLEGSARYMRQQLDRFGGDYRKALAAYNAGAGAVEQHGGVPPYRETQDYVSKIMGARGPGDMAGKRVRLPDGKVYRIPKGATADQVSRFLASLKPAGAPTEAPAPAVAAAPQPAAPEPSREAFERQHYESLPPFQRALLQFSAGAQRTLPGLGEAPGPNRFPAATGGLEQVAERAGGVAGFSAVAIPVGLLTEGLGAGAMLSQGVAAGVAGAAAPGTPKERVVRGGTLAVAGAATAGVGQAVASQVAGSLAKAAPEVAAALGREFNANVANGVRSGLSQQAAENAAQKILEQKIAQATNTAMARAAALSRGASAVGGAAAFGAAQPVAEAKLLGRPAPTTGDMVQGGLEMLALNLILEGPSVARGVAARGIKAGEAKMGAARPERPRFQPNPEERAAAQANIATPPAMPDRMRTVSKESSAELGQALVKYQARGPLSFTLPDGLKIADAHVFPNLVRIFPGDPKSVRLTVLDKDTGRVHSVALPDVSAVRQAIGVEPRTEPKPELKPVAEKPVEKPRPLRARARRIEEAKAEEAAADALQVRQESVPQGIAALERQIAERPGDKRVKRWKRRLEKLRAIEPTPLKKIPLSELAERTKTVKTEAGKRALAKELGARQVGTSPTTGDVTQASAWTAHLKKVRAAAAARPKDIAAQDALFQAEQNFKAWQRREQAKRAGPGQPRRTADQARGPKAPPSAPIGKKSGITREATPAEAATMKPGEIRQVGSAQVVRRTVEGEAQLQKDMAATAAAVEKGPRLLADRRRAEGAGPGGVDRRVAARRVQEMRGTVAEGRKRLEEVRLASTRVDLERIYQRHTGKIPGPEVKTSDIRKELAAEARSLIQGAQQAVRGAKEAKEAKKGPAGREWPDLPAARKKELLAAYPDALKGLQADVDKQVKAAKAEEPRKRTFTEEFEDLARQGRTLEEATDQAAAISGSEPPAGLDLQGRWSRASREGKEGRGQEDMFGGAAMLGAPAGQRTEADIDQPERAKPPAVSEAGVRAEKPSEAKDVPLEGLWYWEGFQNRDVSRGAEPTQDPGDLVNAAHVRMLSETRGGFDLDEVRRRPILVWTDAAGELGAKGRRYVIDGHHRAYMAKGAGAEALPAVEVFGDLAYAKSQALVGNVAGVPNTYSEQARIARELLDKGVPINKVASQVRVSISKVKKMVDFAHLDPAVRNTFFPSGQETEILGIGFGETVGRYARQSPGVMTVNMQNQWLARAVDEDMRLELFNEKVKQFHDRIEAARAAIPMELQGEGTRLTMTPAQFDQTAGRLIHAIEGKRQQLQLAERGLEAVAEMARGEGHDIAAKFAEKKLREIGQEGARLIKAKKEIDLMIRDALIAGAKGERDLPTSFDLIQKRVDEIVGPNPLPSRSLVGKKGDIIRGRRGDILRAIRDVRRKLRGRARRNPVVKKLAQGPPDPTGAVARILAALKAAKPKRAEQEKLYKAERKRRIGMAQQREQGKVGQERLHARLSAFKGAYERVDFESIAKALSQKDIDELVEIILNHPGLKYFQQTDAADALRNLLGEEGGKVPQQNELELLEIVYGTKFVKTIADLRPEILQARHKLFRIGNVARAAVTAFDLSAPLRQGLWLGAGYPKEWVKSFAKMHHFFFSQKAFDAGMEAIYRDPLYQAAREGGLSITRPGSVANVAAQEEAFLGAEFLEKIPVYGPGVRASNRAYSGFLNKLRFDAFKQLYRAEQAQGKDVTDPRFLRDISKLINSGTGRGDSEFLSRNAELLSNLFFSMRFQKSRLDLINPHRYLRSHPAARKEYWRISFMLAAEAATVLTLLAWMTGGTVELDRRSPDFMKLRVKGVVYDLMGGLTQYIRFIPALLETVYDEQKGNKPRYGLNAKDLAYRFIETKLAPIPSFVKGMLAGRASNPKYPGERFHLGPEAAKLFIPMLGQDMFEVLMEDPSQLPYAAPAAAYGVGVQTYPKR